MSIKTKIFLLTVVFFILALNIVSIFFPSRYWFGRCASTGRFYSDQERIEMAVQNLVDVSHRITRKNNYTVREDGAVVKGDISFVEKAIPYSSVAEFLEENPNCCELTNNILGEQSISFFSRLTGKVNTYVRLRYKIKYANPPTTMIRTEYEVLSDCGINRNNNVMYLIETY